MSLERFARRMKLRARNVPREVNKVVRRAALAVDQAVVLGTPVDTGRARSNWIVSLGSEGTEQSRNAKGQFGGRVIEPYSPIPAGTDPGKFGESGNAQAAISQGQEQISRSQPGAAIIIANNLDYIARLNEGSSSQAPAMFVEAAVQAAVGAIKGVTIDTGR